MQVCVLNMKPNPHKMVMNDATGVLEGVPIFPSVTPRSCDEICGAMNLICRQAGDKTKDQCNLKEAGALSLRWHEASIGTYQQRVARRCER